MGFIYKIVSKVDGRMYIGMTILTPEKRFKKHCRTSLEELKKGNKRTYFHQALLKYGFDNFLVDKIIETNDNSLLPNLEIDFIKKYKTTQKKYGFNILPGGIGGCSDETKQKISETLKLYYKEHPEVKDKISENLKGRKLSDEHRNNISKSQLIDHPMSEERRNDMRKRMKGKKYALGYRHTEETKQKIGLHFFGNKYAKGNKLSDETKNKMSESQKIRRIKEKSNRVEKE